MSLDVRDVLNIPESGPRPAKKQKTAVARTNLKGLAREVQSLGGDNPIAIVPEVSLFKKRRFGSRKPAAKWELRQFTNSARGDNGALVLRHWRRKHEDAPHPEDQMQDFQSQTGEGAETSQETTDLPEDSTFAKFNVEVSVPQYGEDQYNSILQNDDWTKDETDYLLQVVKDFDLRWPVIWDRYEYVPGGLETGDTDGPGSTAVIPAPKPRTMEELKARYYEVAAKMMAVQKPAQYMTKPEFDLYEIMTNFNPGEERRRKEFAISTMARSKDEAREEESLLLEVKRILARTERFNEERRELYQRLDYPHTDQDISIYKSSQGLQTLLQTLMNVDKSKKRKSLAEAAAATAGPTPTSAGFAAGQGPHPSSEGPGNRRESIAASAPGGHIRRDSLVSATPATPADATPTSAADKKKKGGAAQFERRKLSDQEEIIYGVTHHERLTSGPTFRYEKINKLYSHKSGQQQLRITNLLTELDVPSRLIMPTAAVTAQFEVLWAAVTTLVDLRKVSDKIEAEIKLEEAKKAERDRARGIVPEAEKKKGEEGEQGADGAERAVPDSQDSSGDAAEGGEDGAAAASGEGQQAGRSQTTTVAIKDEDGGGQEKSRPGSSGAHKRSASVLSAASDKSSKRQKK
jgi:DNA methyltransferase 1-associated protein 1